MSERKDNWNLLNKIGKLKPVGEGSDSNVHAITSRKDGAADFVVKIYQGPGFDAIPEEKRKEVLRQYYTDTMRAKRILDSNPNPAELLFFYVLIGFCTSSPFC